MKYDDLTIRKLRELPIFDVCSKLGISLYGMGQLTRRTTCWYHDDQHPSMHVNKKKNIYKCFVCGKGGDVIRLVQDYENLSFVEACDWLVKEFSVTVIPSDVKSKKADAKCEETPEPKPVVPLDADLVRRSLSVHSEFCKSVVASGYLTEGQMRHAAERYCLGASKDGGVIFWEIDQRHQVRTGKIMYYQPDCHRDKQHNPTWVHALFQDQLPAGFTLQHCLFGLHLLASDGRCKKEDVRSLCIVESEKTAIICSELFPDFLWLSCGGLQMFKPQLLEPLVHHKVILFPDTDTQGEAYRQWSEIATQAQRHYKFRYPLRVSSLLERHATVSQKQRKIDIVDFLYETSKPNEFCVQTP